MSSLRLQCALSIAIITAFSKGVSHAAWNELTCEEKFTECASLFQNGLEQSCEHHNRTIHCLGSYIDNNCVEQSLSAGAWRNVTIKNRFCPNDCFHVPGATQQECINSFFPSSNLTDPPPELGNCIYPPGLLSTDTPSLVPLGIPSLSPPPSSPECTLPDYETYYRQHCSLFSLSHLRSFGDRSHPLQTCVLLGSVYLLKHETVSIAVTGQHSVGNSGVYTHITEVNVTLHPHECLSHPVTYTATVDSLPQSSAGGKGSPLQLTVNQTMATILAPWINTSIVIHRIDGYLSVTMQVPEPLSRANDVTGLCSRGCPSGFAVTERRVALPEYKCQQNRQITSLMCLALGLATPAIGSISYSELCVYDILLTHDLALLSLYSALNNDTLRLPDITEIAPPTLPNTTPPDTKETTPTPNRQATVSIIINSPTQGAIVSQTHQITHSAYLTIICCLLALLR